MVSLLNVVRDKEPRSVIQDLSSGLKLFAKLVFLKYLRHLYQYINLDHGK
jgi:hypothetical protein